MIKYVKGDIFQSRCSALVNPVNCVGVMGAGLALQFKNRFPKNYIYYRRQCLLKRLSPGDCLLFKEEDTYILNVATKDHWKDPSLVEYVEDGLVNLKFTIQTLGVDRVAVPALGCGLGGLDWIREVKPLVEKHLADTPKQILVYLPN